MHRLARCRSRPLISARADWSRRSAALPERSHRSKRGAGLKCVTLRPVGQFDAVDALRAARGLMRAPRPLCAAACRVVTPRRASAQRPTGRRDTLLAGPRPSPARRSNRCDSVCADCTPRAPRAPPGGCSGRPFRAWTAACQLVLLLLIRRCASPCVQPAPGLLRLRALTTGDRRACLQPRPPSVERAAGLTPPCEAALVERPAVATFHLRERTPLLRGGSSSAHQRGRQADPQRLERSVSANGRRGPASPSGAGGGVHRVQVQDRPDRVITRSLRRDRQVAADWRVVSWWPGFRCTAPGNSGSRAQSRRCVRVCRSMPGCPCHASDCRVACIRSGDGARSSSARRSNRGDQQLVEQVREQDSL